MSRCNESLVMIPQQPRMPNYSGSGSTNKNNAFSVMLKVMAAAKNNCLNILLDTMHDIDK